jgi:hypothetical protein
MLLNGLNGKFQVIFLMITLAIFGCNRNSVETNGSFKLDRGNLLFQDTDSEPIMPMPVEVENSLYSSWLQKTVRGSRLLDDMENPETWSHEGPGEILFTTDRAIDGCQSVRLTSQTFAGATHEILGRTPKGIAVAKRKFKSQNWQEYNRLSFWVYPQLPGFNAISMYTVLHNDGTKKVPDSSVGVRARNYFLLKNNQWNHVVWEIEHLPRDSVTAIDFAYRGHGNEPGATETVCFDIDHLELQQVNPDHYHGWKVSPGKIAFSHVGYLPEATKTAIASDITSSTFKVIEVQKNKTAFEAPVQNITTQLGEFQLMDFSQLTKPGFYYLQAGNTKTRPFNIAGDLWHDTIYKIINFFYCQRCGTEIPTIHSICHKDWTCIKDDKQISINGGWHDAGDLSQGIKRTSDAVYSMLSLAQVLQDSEPALAQRLLTEARWGLDWLLSTRFGDGYRPVWVTMDFWTDNIIGTKDDVAQPAENTPFANFVAATAEAIAARIIKETDPALAARALKAAEEDFKFAVEQIPQFPGDDFSSQDLFWCRSRVELMAAGALASIELYKTTAKDKYAKKAFEFADIILQSQQQTFASWKLPLTGFFYTGPNKEKILHQFYCDTNEHLPALSLAKLCELFPEHPKWINWYASTVLYSEFLKTTSKITYPYQMLPASIYSIDESNEPAFRDQVINGIALGRKHYLRIFPAWTPGVRGNNAEILSQAQALSAIANLRNDRQSGDLAIKQVEWTLGANPFCQSQMFGQGYDYPPMYSGMSGDMVGAMPVGIKTHGNEDIPFWPVDNCYCYKEVWVVSPPKILSIIADLYKPTKTAVTSNLNFNLSEQTSTDGNVTIRLNATGTGKATFTVRFFNLSVDKTTCSAELNLKKPQIITFKAKVLQENKPWVAVVIPNNDYQQRKEIIGSSRQDWAQ